MSPDTEGLRTRVDEAIVAVLDLRHGTFAERRALAKGEFDLEQRLENRIRRVRLGWRLSIGLMWVCVLLPAVVAFGSSFHGMSFGLLSPLVFSICNALTAQRMLAKLETLQLFHQVCRSESETNHEPQSPRTA